LFLTVSWLSHSANCHRPLHVHFGAQRRLPLFLEEKVSLGGRKNLLVMRTCVGWAEGKQGG
jgi:hypothetical protein